MHHVESIAIACRCSTDAAATVLSAPRLLRAQASSSLQHAPAALLSVLQLQPGMSFSPKPTQASGPEQKHSGPWGKASLKSHPQLGRPKHGTRSSREAFAQLFIEHVLLEERSRGGQQGPTCQSRAVEVCSPAVHCRMPATGDHRHRPSWGARCAVHAVHAVQGRLYMSLSLCAPSGLQGWVWG